MKRRLNTVLDRTRSVIINIAFTFYLTNLADSYSTSIIHVESHALGMTPPEMLPKALGMGTFKEGCIIVWLEGY